jgi:hypothetical protein
VRLVHWLPLFHLYFFLGSQGLVSYADFKRVFGGAEDEIESRAMMGEGGSTFEQIAPRIIPELVDMHKVTIKPTFAHNIFPNRYFSSFFVCLVPCHDAQGGPEETIEITQDLLQNFKVKVRQGD